MAESSFLDVEALTAAAMDGMRNAYHELLEELAETRPGDELYGFGFYSHQATYLGVAAFSEQGLAEVAQHYEASSLSGDHPYLKPKSLERWSTELRWSPADSPLHCSADGHIGKAEGVMDAAHAAYEERRSVERPEWDSDYDKAADLRDLIYDTLVNVLCALDAEGVFGPNRDRLTLNIWEGDQSDKDRIAFAGRCNPAEVAARFAAEELASYG